MNQSKLRIPSVPHLVHIETTYRCNRQCLFCYNPRRDMPDDFERIDRIVKSIYDSWIPHVYLIGGEPSLLGVHRLNGFIEKLSERSSVTIVTNGEVYLAGLSDKLACVGVPIHGESTTHDFLANRRSSYRTVIKTTSQYVADGFDVRCIPVLTRQNHDQMYDVIKLAHDLGMESVFVDRYEEGGLGSKSVIDLKPSVDQFHVALEQMISARDDFGIPVGWGTAIPYCLDPLLVQHNMISDCGAGVTFAAVNPKGEVRSCNQSEIVYGNVINEPIEVVWHKPALNEFRDLGWVTGSCRECNALLECLGGCKVDVNFSDRYCVDYAMRDPDISSCRVYLEDIARPENLLSISQGLRRWQTNRYLRINTAYVEKYLVTRYQTVEIESIAIEMVMAVKNGVGTERQLIDLFVDRVEEQEIRMFVSKLVLVGAIDIEGG